MRLRWMLFAPLAIAGVIAFVAVGGGIVMWLWNWLTPALFGWRAITFWQAIALLALCRILFGGAGVRGPHGPRMDLGRHTGERMADRVAHRWPHMTPEERERFRQRFRERCGVDPAAADTNAS